MKRHNRMALAVAALALVIPVSGCASLLSPHQTADYHYNAGDGAWGTVGDVEVRGLMLITDKEGKGDSQLFFTLINKGDSSAKVSLDVGGEKTTETVDAGKTFVQDPESSASTAKKPIVLKNLDAKPGDLTEVTVKVGSEEKKIEAQVLSDALPYYKDYVPTEAPSKTPSDESSESGEPSADASQTGEDTTQTGEDATQTGEQGDSTTAGVNG